MYLPPFRREIDEASAQVIYLHVQWPLHLLEEDL